jgi:hypothetical protein
MSELSKERALSFCYFRRRFRHVKFSNMHKSAFSRASNACLRRNWNTRLCCNFDVIDAAGWRRRWSAIFAKSGYMEFDCFAKNRLSFFDCGARGNTTRKIGHITGKIVFRLFNYDRVAHISPHFLSPACLRILFSVPGAKSSLGFPATVTRPSFVACLNCLWLPRVAIRSQPSS